MARLLNFPWIYLCITIIWALSIFAVFLTVFAALLFGPMLIIMMTIYVFHYGFVPFLCLLIYIYLMAYVKSQRLAKIQSFQSQPVVLAVKIKSMKINLEMRILLQGIFVCAIWFLRCLAICMLSPKDSELIKVPQWMSYTAEIVYCLTISMNFAIFLVFNKPISHCAVTFLHPIIKHF